MTAVTPGTGGTLVATTAEAALQEILSYIRIQESIAGRNPSEVTSVNARWDSNAGTLSGTFSFSASRTISGDGSLSIQANTYLILHGYQPGTGGTFKSASPEAAAIEILEWLQIKEADGTANPNNENRITSTYDSDRGVYSGSFTLPVTLSLDSAGNAVYTAQQYLS